MIGYSNSISEPERRDFDSTGSDNKNLLTRAIGNTAILALGSVCSLPARAQRTSFK